MPSAEKRIPITTAIPDAGPLEMAVSVHFPSQGLTDDATVLVCWPGGSYGRIYFTFPEAGYNFAEYVSQAGIVVVSVDPLGVGESSCPLDGDLVCLQSMAQAAADLVTELKKQLVAGTLDPALPAIGTPHFVGVGHSMGGEHVIVQQALFGSYDAVANLGSTIHIRDSSNDDCDYSTLTVDELMTSPAAEFLNGEQSWPSEYGTGYIFLNRALLSGFFHLPDVAEELIARDIALASSWPRRPLVEVGSGIMASYAPQVTAPVFLAFGDIDLSMTPHVEVAQYPASNDVTVFKLAGSAHCHNFSTTRTGLWDRLIAWL